MNRSLQILSIISLCMGQMAFASKAPKKLKITEQATTAGVVQTRTPLIGPLATIVSEYAYEVPVLNEDDESDPRIQLLNAVNSDDIKQLKKLIKSGIEVNFLAGDTKLLNMELTAASPLMIAKSFEAIEILISNGADINAQDLTGDTVLLYQIRSVYDNTDERRLKVANKLKIIEYLIMQGADPLIGRTITGLNSFELLQDKILLGQISSGLARTIEQLLQKAPIIQAKLKAQEKELCEITKKTVIKNEQLKLPTSLLFAIKKGYTTIALDIINKIEKKSELFNTKDEEGRSALMLAVEFNNTEITRALLKGQKINSKSPEAQQIVKIARKNNNAVMLKLLHEAGFITESVSLALDSR